jgi:hypothetical protein
MSDLLRGRDAELSRLRAAAEAAEAARAAELAELREQVKERQ